MWNSDENSSEPLEVSFIKPIIIWEVLFWEEREFKLRFIALSNGVLMVEEPTLKAILLCEFGRISGKIRKTTNNV